MSAVNIILLFAGGIGVGITGVIAFLFYLSSRTKQQPYVDPDNAYYDIDCDHNFQTKYAFNGEILVCKYCKWTVINSGLLCGDNREKQILNNLFEKLDAPVRIAITSDDSAI